MQLLQHHPTAAINYHGTSVSSSTSQYEHNPECVVPWEQEAGSGTSLDNLITQHTLEQPAIGSFAAPMVPSTVAFYSTEYGPFVAFTAGVIEPINQLLMEDGGQCCGVAAKQFCWAAQKRSSMPPDSHEDSSFVPVDRRKPDLELIHQATLACRCAIEVKKR